MAAARNATSQSAELLFVSSLAGLAAERRASPHTLRAYGDDAKRFLIFLGQHRGGRASLPLLKSVQPSDIRAFLTLRRKEGLGPRGIQRAMAALRSFYRYLEREALAD